MKRALKALSRAAGFFPLTWTGLVVVAGCLICFAHYGLGRIDLVLLGIGAVGLGLAGLTLPLTAAGALLAWRAARGQQADRPLRLECGYWARTGFSLPTLWYLPFVHLSWSWESPVADVRMVRLRRRLHEEVRPRRRGIMGAVTRRLEVADIFGITRLVFRLEQRRAVRFLPWIGGLKQMHVVRGMSGGDDMYHPEGAAEGDPYDTRHYSPGDPIRFVLWKVFAKSRDLIVRTPERAISPVRQTMAYLVAGEGDEAAAGAARVAVDVGVLGGDWVLGADGCGEVADTKDHALEILARSSRAAASQQGGGLSSFLDRAGQASVSRAVVFVPPRPGPWLKRVIAAAGGSGSQLGRVDFVVGTDGIRRGGAPSWVSRMMRRGGAQEPEDDGGHEPTGTDELSEVVRALGGSRANVLVVDRPAGQVFSSHHFGAGGSS